MRRKLSGRKTPILALGTLAASGLLLAGCGEEVPTDRLFSSVDQCVSYGMDRQLCQTAFQDAVETHLANAPRFDGMAACEAEYGEKQCVEEPASNRSTGGNVFVPFMAGYLISSAVDNIGDYYRYRRSTEQGSGYSGGYSGGSAPIYRKRGGQTVTTTSTGRDTSVSTSAQTTKPVNVNTRTVSRQGFGGRSSFGFGG